MDQGQFVVLSGSQFRGFDQYVLDMFVSLFRKRGSQDRVGGTLFFSAEAAITDRLLDRPEARYVPDLERPGERGDGSDPGNGSEEFDPISQQWVPLQRTHQSVFRSLTPYDRLPAQPQQREFSASVRDAS